jgi:hypothetical protein
MTQAEDGNVAGEPQGIIAVVGAFEGTHVGGSLIRAAEQLGIRTVRLDVADAHGRNHALDALSWHVLDRRLLRMRRYSTAVVTRCAATRARILIATGTAPLTREALRQLRAMGTFCINYSTDDPWNAANRTRWFFRALPEYDLIFSTRRSNLADFGKLGCHHANYLPFGYDETLSFPVETFEQGPDVLFVGGADSARVAFMSEYLRTDGPRIALAGGYWQRFAVTRPHAIGVKSPQEVNALTAAAKVNLCLVRRANRDGHVMRSFEIAAIGGCMLAEDTQEHREIFGDDGECVVYFKTPEQAAQRARELADDAPRRARLAAAVRSHVQRGHNAYRDRLETMVRTATKRSTPS